MRSPHPPPPVSLAASVPRGPSRPVSRQSGSRCSAPAQEGVPQGNPLQPGVCHAYGQSESPAQAAGDPSGTVSSAGRLRLEARTQQGDDAKCPAWGCPEGNRGPDMPQLCALRTLHTRHALPPRAALCPPHGPHLQLRRVCVGLRSQLPASLTLPHASSHSPMQAGTREMVHNRVPHTAPYHLGHPPCRGPHTPHPTFPSALWARPSSSVLGPVCPMPHTLSLLHITPSALVPATGSHHAPPTG